MSSYRLRPPAGIRLLALFLVALASGTRPEVFAQTLIDTDTPFSGTIAVDETINLIAPGGAINGPVVNDGQLWFNNPDIASQTVSATISGSGSVYFWQPVGVTFSGSNTYTGGTVLYDGTTSITGSLVGGGDLELDGAAGTLLEVSGLLSTGLTRLGSTVGTFGDVTISNGGSWNSLGTLYAGNSGTSTVTVSGGALSAVDAYFGSNVGSSGTLLLSSGSLTTSGVAYFGYFGDSTLSVTGGRLASASDMYIGYGPGSGAGTLSSGSIAVAGKLFVGKDGVGSLTVNGGSLTSGWGVIGQSTGGVGTVTMNATTWQVTNDVEVGSTGGGGGNLVLSGGNVVSGRALVGYLLGSTGTATISSGTWSTTGSEPDGTLQVGYNGNGRMTISGGSVVAAGGNIGWDNAGNGTVVVNSGQLTVSGLLNIGKYARGTLQLSGGTITTGQVVVGYDSHLGFTGSGTVTVTGGTWNSSLSLTVGQGGNGIYTQSGGSVTAAAGYIGSANTLATGGTGSVTVTGGTLAYGGNLAVGNAQAGSTGAGTLTIGGSGYVSVNDTLSRASNGAVAVNGGGTLSIGIGGITGALATDLANDGLVIFNRSTDYTYVGVLSGTGGVTKQGASTLTIAGTNSYSGATAVSSGTLNLAGRLGATSLTVYAGAALSGTGSILGPVSIGAGGTITPGVGAPGTLTVGDFMMSGNTSLAFMQITGSTAGQYDKVAAQSLNPLAWGNGTVSIAMSVTPTYDEGTTFNLFSGFGSYSGAIAQIVFGAAGTSYAGLTFSDVGGGVWETGRNSGFQYLRFDTSTGDLVVVPEPNMLLASTAGLAAWGAATWVRRRRRRDSAAGGGPLSPPLASLNSSSKPRARQSTRIGSLPG